jgi:flagellar biogenesis protein FliO
MRRAVAELEAGRGNGTDFFTVFLSGLRRALHRTPLGRLKIRRDRRLRLRETLSLGERRLVAIVECDRQEFLVAATAQAISLLAPLGEASDEVAGGGAALVSVGQRGR